MHSAQWYVPCGELEDALRVRRSVRHDAVCGVLDDEVRHLWDARAALRTAAVGVVKGVAFERHVALKVRDDGHARRQRTTVDAPSGSFRAAATVGRGRSTGWRSGWLKEGDRFKFWGGRWGGRLGPASGPGRTRRCGVGRHLKYWSEVSKKRYRDRQRAEEKRKSNGSEELERIVQVLLRQNHTDVRLADQ